MTTPNNSDQSALHDDLRARLDAMFEFLDGSGTLDGRWFGDETNLPMVAGRPARYWWRTPLLELAAELHTALSMPASEAVALSPNSSVWTSLDIILAAGQVLKPRDPLLAADIIGHVQQIVTALEPLTTPQPAPAAHAGGEADAESERMKADMDAMIGGLGFLVDGVRIDPVRVSMLHYKETLTHPSPIPVDALRELEASYRRQAAEWSRNENIYVMATANGFTKAADELTALLSGGAAREGK